MFEEASIEQTLQKLATDQHFGLTEEVAKKRWQHYGKNELKSAPKKGNIARFLTQLQDPLLYVLLAAAIVSILLKEYSDALIIGFVVFLNALVGMIQEGKAQKALDALKKLASPHAQVIRQGAYKKIPATSLTVGDLVCLEAGDMVPADLRLLESAGLKIDEATLTGEAVAAEKDALFWVHAAKEKGKIPLGDRKNMAYMSTIVTHGRGRGVVTAVGMETEIGRIASQMMEEKEELTPLQKRLGDLGNVLSLLSLGLCVVLFVLALLQRRNPMEMLLTAISLAVAAVPEGLPAVVTICLSFSVTRMVKANTIIRRLPSVETLGAVSVVCSDKTGTLTQNRMTVVEDWTAGKKSDSFFQAMVLCNDAVRSAQKCMGDPTELALLEYAFQYGYQKQQLEIAMPRVDERAFDSERKMMSTLHRMVGQPDCVSFTKGAPDEVIRKCTFFESDGKILPLSEQMKNRMLRTVDDMSENALRTLAFAMCTKTSVVREEKMIFLGVVGMKDPARPEAARAVEIFKQAGVKTVMITGDHVNTAWAIARQLGIATQQKQCITGSEMDSLTDEELTKRLRDISVCARVSPAQKVRIVKSFQRRGEIVAMTGDGVNDAPSLKTADIGIAMGLSGTDVAKQASDMILTDDNFATIEKAIEEGRGVYENIRKAVIFLLSSNLGEIMTMFVAVLCGMAPPLQSNHILWINLITDSLPALALGVDGNDGESMMHHKPRAGKESLFSQGGLQLTVFYGVLIAGISLTAFLLLPLQILRNRGIPVTVHAVIALLGDPAVLAKAQTYTFTVLGISQLFHALGMRDVKSSFFCSKPWQNRLMLLSFFLGMVMQVAVTKVPFLIRAFGTASLSLREWICLTVLSAMPLLAHECIILIDQLFFSKKLFLFSTKNDKIEDRCA